MKTPALKCPTVPPFRTVLLLCLLALGCMTSAQGRPQPILGDYDAEPRIGDHVDTDRLVKRLVDLHANTYMWLIWHSANDWDDLKVFLPKAQQAGITVWVYLVPQSESGLQDSRLPYSEPFRLDYVRWAEEIARLSLQDANLTGYVIDDFWTNILPDRFSPDYIRRMVAAGKAINPKLKFYPLMYFQQIDIRFVDTLAPLIDGVVAAYPPDGPSVESALTFLNDRFHLPQHAAIVFPAKTRSQPGDHGFICQQARVTDAAHAQLSFRYRDDYEGPTEGYHRLQVRVDDQVVWDKDVAGHDDGAQTVDLSKVVGDKQTVKLSLGVFDAKGVGNFGVEAWFSDLSARGLDLKDADLKDADPGTGAAWSTDVAGSFSVQLVKKRDGAGRFHLPLIVMPDGDVPEYGMRYTDEASPENIARRVKIATDLAEKGQIEGVVIYCLDKQDGSATFEAVRKVYEAAQKAGK